MNENIYHQMVEIFTQTQVTAATHQKYSLILKKLYDQVEFDTFFASLNKILSHILLTDYKSKNLYVDKVTDFFASFCSHLKPHQPECMDTDAESEEDVVEHPLLFKIFELLLEVLDVDSDIVRYRACTLVNKILDSLVGMDVSSELCDQIENHVLDRLHDPKVAIRLQAIMALHRLQDPSRPGDPIIQEFMNFMDFDASAKIRKVCVEKIAARRDVISHIMKRIRDVDESVRLSAYKRLCNLTENLKIADKRLIIKCGYHDSSDKIKYYVMNTVVLSWLDHYGGDYLKLMKAMRLDADENDLKETTYIYELILQTIFKHKSYHELQEVVPINEEKLIPFEQLNWETASYWRILVQYLREADDLEEHTSAILPELVYFCQYIKSYCLTLSENAAKPTQMEQQFILKQMFLITKGYDIADTTTRQCLNKLVCEVLEKFTLASDVIGIVIANLENTIPNVDNRSRFVTEIISEIMYPLNSEECEKLELERSYQISQLQVKLNCLMEAQKNAISSEDYMEANRLKFEIENAKKNLQTLNESTKENENVIKRTDIPTIIKYLDISSALLMSPQIRQLSPLLETLKDDVIQEVLIHDNDVVRVKAMKCYALCCIVDKKSAKMGIHIFSAPIFAYKAGEECDTETLMVCIAAVVDLLRIYGSHLMAEPVEGEEISDSQREEHSRIFTGGTSLTELIQGLVDLMDDELPEIQFTAGQGLCSLVQSESVHSASIISRLVLKWCSPAADEVEGEKLRQIIGLTLQILPKLKNGTEQLEGCVLMTIKALISAPQYSPLADVNVDNIAKFLLALCKTSVEGDHIHVNLAMTICCEMRDRPKNKVNLTYSKMLLMLDIPNDKFAIRDLLVLCDNLRDDLRDKQAANNVIKFTNLLKKKCNEEEGDQSMEETQHESEDNESEDETTIRNI